MKHKPSISHDEAVIQQLREDPEFAAEYLKAALADSGRSKGAWIRFNRIGGLQMPMQCLMHRNLTVGFQVCSLVSCRVEFVRFPEPTWCNEPNNGRGAASGVGKTVRGMAMLSHSPIQSAADWLGFVNEPQTAELAALRRSVNRGCPYGDDEWTGEVVGPLSLESTMRPRGRPGKVATSAKVVL